MKLIFLDCNLHTMPFFSLFKCKSFFFPCERIDSFLLCLKMTNPVAPIWKLGVSGSHVSVFPQSQTSLSFLSPQCTTHLTTLHPVRSPDNSRNPLSCNYCSSYLIGVLTPIFTPSLVSLQTIYHKRLSVQSFH